ncbi:MAG: DUF1624 domain-containing protein [Oscillospiraceae bacterium]|nr:DUF1624 domain-containing protein [Oscillospiraceae bacterium]
MKKRISALDLLRGTAMIYVMFYHLMFDLKYIYGSDTPDVLTPNNEIFEVSHVFFLWILFSVSGVCVGFSRDPLKRGVLLYLAGFGITLATQIFMPSELIVFGVLSCFGACMTITALCRPLLDKLPPVTALIWFGLWVLSMHFPQSINLIFTQIPLNIPSYAPLYPIGITGNGFYSADYFPLIPYIFMYLTGYALYPLVKEKMPKWFCNVPEIKPVNFIGRHSLIFYIVHQPVLLAICELLFMIG